MAEPSFLSEETIMEECCMKDIKSEKSVGKSVKSSEDTDSGDEIPPDTTPTAPTHDIRCGGLNGKLHMQRFICPGIHRRCVEFEGRMVTPRQFTIMAEKDKQKDWKGSIRLGRCNLRTLMEHKTLDFHDHATNCSLKCQSRNYIKNRKNEAMESLLDSFNGEGGDGQHHDFDDNFGFTAEGIEGNSDGGTRKSSSVLEDFVTQGINGGARCSEGDIKIDDFLNGFSSNPIVGNNNTSYRPSKPQHLSQNPQPQRRMSTPNIGCKMGTTKKTGMNKISQSQFVTSNANEPIPPFSMSNANDAALAIILQSLLAEQQQQQQSQQQTNLPPQNNLNRNFFNNLAAMGNTNLNANGNGPMMGIKLENLLNPQPNIYNTTPAVNIDPARRVDSSAHTNNPVGGNIRKIMETSPVLFWSRMRELGILEDLLKSLSATVDQLRHLYLHGGVGTEEFAAEKLSALSNVLDLGVIFGEKIHSRYVQTTLESNLITKELLELQRKAEEQKVKLESAKRKSQVFDRIMNSSQNEGGGATTANNSTPFNNNSEQQQVDQGQQPEFKKIHLNI